MLAPSLDTQLLDSSVLINMLMYLIPSALKRFQKYELSQFRGCSPKHSFFGKYQTHPTRLLESYRLRCSTSRTRTFLHPFTLQPCLLNLLHFCQRLLQFQAFEFAPCCNSQLSCASNNEIKPCLITCILVQSLGPCSSFQAGRAGQAQSNVQSPKGKAVGRGRVVWGRG